jgi:rhodanese-related sulfurtransferase
MHRYFLILIGLLAQGALAQTTTPDSLNLSDSIPAGKIPAVSVADLIEMNKQPLYILDAREEKEFKVSHIKNARNVGYFWFDMRKIYDIPYDANMVIYCTVGGRSEKIAEKIIGAGYQQVYLLQGGIFEWINKGQPVYKENGVQTSEIHIFNEDMAQLIEKGTKVNF